MRKIVLFFLALFVISACAYPGTVLAADLTVSAAISLKNAFEEIGKQFEAKHAGSKVRFNFGGSGNLARQIAGGAPVDVFASAAQKDMDGLNAQGLVLADTRVDFVKNRVVLIVPKNGTVKSFDDLAGDTAKRIAAGNPKTVPAGRYAAEIFEFYKITPKIQHKLIYAENVRQVLDYVARGEVDAGVVYATDAAIRSKEVRVVTEAPEKTHKPVVYPIAVIKESKNSATAKAFIEEVRSAQGTAILKKYGFSIP